MDEESKNTSQTRNEMPYNRLLFFRPICYPMTEDTREKLYFHQYMYQ
jgi:hypothetical protein